MSAGILLTLDKVHEHLKSKGFEPTETMLRGHTGRYRYWKAPWGHHFAVPDEDYKCPTWVLEDIVTDAEATRPAA